MIGKFIAALVVVFGLGLPLASAASATPVCNPAQPGQCAEVTVDSFSGYYAVSVDAVNPSLGQSASFSVLYSPDGSVERSGSITFGGRVFNF